MTTSMKRPDFLALLRSDPRAAIERVTRRPASVADIPVVQEQPAAWRVEQRLIEAATGRSLPDPGLFLLPQCQS